MRPTFEASNATEVRLFDQVGGEVPLTGDASSGEAVATPRRSTFYVLSAKEEGGRDSAFAYVEVDRPLGDAFLVAVPPEVRPGARRSRSRGGHGEISLTEAGAGRLKTRAR